MNWEAIGAVGEILGAIAVLVTLIYLATQIKQHTLATRAVTNSAYAEAAREFNMAIANSPELARAMANWPENPADATREDARAEGSIKEDTKGRDPTPRRNSIFRSGQR